MAQKFAFLDTTTFLHYPSLEQLDWLRLLSTDDAILIVGQIVVRQLNKLKDGSGARKFRDRANAALKALESHLQDSLTASLRERVELRFAANDPRLDFTARQLVREVEDDWLIANVIEFRENHEDADIVLVTDDLGLQMKARTHNILPFKIPANLRLPEGIDPNERRVRDLEFELRSLKHALPRLRLVFPELGTRLRVSLKRMPRTSEVDVERQMAGVRGKFPKLVKAAGYSAADLMRGPGPENIDAYNLEIDRYWVQYQKYLIAIAEYADAQQRTFELQIALENTGGAPATDIDIFMHFPDGLIVLGEDEPQSAPEEPTAPEMPMSPLEKMKASFIQSPNTDRIGAILATALRPPAIATPDIAPHNVSRPAIRRTNSFEVEFRVNRVKHKFLAHLEPLWVGFDSWENAKSFGIQYSLIAANFPNAVEGRLDLLIDQSSD
jgi:hypothetical protein